MKIQRDHQRFREIVKGKVRRDLKRHISSGEMIGQQGKKLISIPVKSIDIPRFRYGDNTGGVGDGEGQPGDQQGEGEGMGPGGTQVGQHILEVDLTIEELAEILGEELELPRIKPKGKKNITDDKSRYSGLRPTGPESLKHFKRTYRKAMRRMLIEGAYDPDDPRIVIERDDKLYRSWKTIRSPQSNAVVIYMMDVSGSMGDEQKEMVRTQAFWIDAWLRRNYDGIESRYIVHDVRAAEVDRETFFHLREDGGTKISSAFRVAKELTDTKFNPQDWNVYLFYFSDGDNSSETDSRDCCTMIRDHFLPIVNMVAYTQVKSQWGSGQFREVFTDLLGEEEKCVTAQMDSKDDILDAIKALFGKGL